MKRAFVLFVFVWFVSGCQYLQSGEVVGNVRLNEFKSVSDKNASLYIAEAELARDFMPIISSSNESIGGRPLMGTITCRRIDGLDIPEQLKVVKVTVKNGNEIWSTELLRAEIYKPEPDYLTVYFDNGPKWEPSSVADINFEYFDIDGKNI